MDGKMREKRRRWGWETGGERDGWKDEREEEEVGDGGGSEVDGD